MSVRAQPQPQCIGRTNLRSISPDREKRRRRESSFQIDTSSHEEGPTSRCNRCIPASRTHSAGRLGNRILLGSIAHFYCFVEDCDGLLPVVTPIEDLATQQGS